MNIRTVLLGALLAVSPALAQQFTDPSGSPDVIGADAYFDIKSLELTYGPSSDAGTLVTATITFDYNQGNNPGSDPLAPFSYPGVTPVLNVGDLLFGTYTGPTDVSNVQWSSTNGDLNVDWMFGVPLRDRNGFQAGHLYSLIDTANGSLIPVDTAQQVLNNPGGINYRPLAPIWMTGGEDVSGNGSVTITGSLPYEAVIEFLVPADTEAAFFGMDRAFFASASCGNDGIYALIEPRVDPIPEPMTMSLMGAGLVGLAVLKRRRR